jgi:hypothetical protein
MASFDLSAVQIRNRLILSAHAHAQRPAPAHGPPAAAEPVDQPLHALIHHRRSARQIRQPSPAEPGLGCGLAWVNG